ncbi:MAG: class I tRNA ligase family protein [Candidatus Omnitrophota bacterium]|nr:class I tRNA ligase family protein [Candidatus Omnitrophota bacterium]
MKKIKIKISGRPGWHIECSVMSQKFLKTDTLDIHAGGRDLVFPHHENEIAQAEALTGKLFAKYWMHHGLLTINGQKMSKSLGNFITIKDFIVKHKYTDILKIFFLSAHYSQPIDYNEKRITEAKQALERILLLLDKIGKIKQKLKAKGQRQKHKEIEDIKTRFIEAMDDDFNAPRGLASIFELVNVLNKNIDDLDFILAGATTLKELLSIFGIISETSRSNKIFKNIKNIFEPLPKLLSDDKGSDMVESIVDERYIEEMIAKRNEARRTKDYSLADKIRKELEQKDIILEDAKDGATTWRKKL